MRKDVDQQLAANAASQDGVFSLDQARSAGADRRLRWRRVNLGVWRRVGAAGFHFSVAPLVWRGLLRCALWDAGPRALVSHDSAAQLHRFPGFNRDEVHVLVPRAIDHECTIATVHTSRRFVLVRTRRIRGIPVVASADTLVHIAPSLRYRRLSWLVDELLFSKRVELDAIREAFERLGVGYRGLEGLRAVLGDHEPGDPVPESELEKMFLQVAAAHGLPAFARQVNLEGREQVPNRVDFIWRDARLIVELDGRRWHARFRDFDRDHQRDLHWLALGYRTARITWSMLVHDPAGVCADLLAARLAAA